MLGTSSLGRQLGLTFGTVLGRQIALGACRDDENDDFERRPFKPRVPLASLPRAVDLRPWLTPVEDQGALGSCTANALVGAMEYLAFRETGSRVDLSRLFLYYNQRLWDGGVRDDIGARVSDGVRTLARIGVSTEKTWPYEPKLFAVQPPLPVYVEAKRYVASDWWSVPVDVDAFRACLANGFPVAIGTRVTERFMRAPRTGIISMPAAGDRDDARHGRHALLVVGYDDAARTFVVRNSWGRDWGDLGYCYMPYPYVGNRVWTRNTWAIRLASGEHDPAAKPAVLARSMPAAPPSRGPSAGGNTVGAVAGVGTEIAVRMITGSGLIGGLFGGLVRGITPGVAAGISSLRGRDPGALAGPDRSEEILAALRAGGGPAAADARMPWDDGLDERAARARLSATRDVEAGAPEERRARSATPPNAAAEAPIGRKPASPIAPPLVAARPKPHLDASEGAPSAVSEALVRTWKEHGGASGPLGDAIPPAGVMQEGAARGLALQLRGGGIFDWDGDAAPFVLRGSDHLFERWLASGAARSPCGWPAGPAVATGSGRMLVCTRGAIVESPKYGAFALHGPIYAHWRDAGGPDGALGAPVADAEVEGDTGEVSQRFERGALSWSPNEGVRSGG